MVSELLADVPSIARVRGRQFLLLLQTALCHLNILDDPAILESAREGPAYVPTLWQDDPTINPTWLAWVRAFYDQTPHQTEKTIRQICYHLITASRWVRFPVKQ